MKRYIEKFRRYFHIDKELDEEHYGYNREDVEECLSNIDSELSNVENMIMKDEIGKCLQLIENLRDKL